MTKNYLQRLDTNFNFSSSVVPRLCLKNAIKFQMFEVFKGMNLSMTLWNLSPFKCSTRPSPSSLNRCWTKYILLVAKAITKFLALGVWKTSPWANALISCREPLSMPTTTRWPWLAKSMVAFDMDSSFVMTSYIQHS